MNLYRIGNTVLNLDRVNGIQEHPRPADPGAPAEPNVTRVLFDTTTIDLRGIEAQAFRQWYRHAARNLVLQRDEDGEELVTPEEQLKRLAEHLIALIDRARPRNAAVRHAAHRLAISISEYITGELQAVRERGFERSLAASDHGAEHAPESFGATP
jgi:hypothetical protein